MSNPIIILASGAILLTFIGGIVGNILTVYALRYRERKTKNINWLQKISIAFYIVILILIFGVFGYYLILNLFINSNDLLLLCVGILFGIMGSILMNFFSAAFDRHIDSHIEDKCWLNKDGGDMLKMGIPLALLFTYLFGIFVLFTYF